MKNKDNGGWNPYLAGGLAGVVLVLSVLISDQYFGTSTSFIRTAGMIEKLFAPDYVSRTSYFQTIVPEIDWQWMFIAGILLGSFISATTSGSFRLNALPDMWTNRFGSNFTIRFVTAFAGGMLSIFGARLAGG